jgi:hypothetical protein
MLNTITQRVPRPVSHLDVGLINLLRRLSLSLRIELEECEISCEKVTAMKGGGRDKELSPHTLIETISLVSISLQGASEAEDGKFHAPLSRALGRTRAILIRMGKRQKKNKTTT